jgi:DNA polymerase III alpha subunit (gram-positive type)
MSGSTDNVTGSTTTSWNLDVSTSTLPESDTKKIIVFTLVNKIVFTNYNSFFIMFVYFDLETTGLNTKRDRVTQIGAVCGNKTFITFVNPQSTIPEHISQLTNIYANDVCDAPLLPDAMTQWCTWLSKLEGPLVLVGHNINKFDLLFLTPIYTEQLLHAGVRQTLDTLELFRYLRPRKKNSMAALHTEAFGVNVPGAHNALNDAKALQRIVAHFHPDVNTQFLNSFE